MVTRRFVAQEDLHNRLLNEFASLAAAVTAIGATEVNESAFVNYLGRFLMEGELHG